MSDISTAVAHSPRVHLPARARSRSLPRFMASRTGIGIILAGIPLLLIALGPVIAPHASTDFVSVPYAPPFTGEFLFGTDELGRDVWSRFLLGGSTLLWVSVAATVIGVGVGLAIALTAALPRRRLDELVMGTNDIFLAFPQIVLALVMLSATGPNIIVVMIAVAIGHAPRSARVLLGAIKPVMSSDFVAAARASGTPTPRLMLTEVVPNILPTLMVELGIRLTSSIGLVAAISFLGFGVQPPQPDWGYMINENRVGLTVQPWTVLLPVLAIVMLTVGVNLITEGYAQSKSRGRLGGQPR